MWDAMPGAGAFVALGDSFTEGVGDPYEAVARLSRSGGHAAPWVARRLRGVSTGDGVPPKRPELLPLFPQAL
jgi:hypothetical protein